MISIVVNFYFSSNLSKKAIGSLKKSYLIRLSVSKSTTSKVIKSLVKKGYIRKKKDPDDKRISRIYLTDKKDEIENIIEALDEKFEDEMLEGFSKGINKNLEITPSISWKVWYLE